MLSVRSNEMEIWSGSYPDLINAKRSSWLMRWMNLKLFLHINRWQHWSCVSPDSYWLLKVFTGYRKCRKLLNLSWIIMLEYNLYNIEQLRIPPDLYAAWPPLSSQSLCTFISAGSKFAQLQCLWRSKDAGQVSALSWGMATYTCMGEYIFNWKKTVWNLTDAGREDIIKDAIKLYYGKCRIQGFGDSN